MINPNNTTTYEEAREIASHGDLDARQKLAANESAPLEILYYLATDESEPVRRAVAANAASPAQADFLLSNDTEESIRLDLASKIGRQLGDRSDEFDVELSKNVKLVLENLVKDQLGAVRAIVSEEIKRLINVPAGVVSKLARDTEASVAAPILEHSPLLEDDELISIITEGVRVEALTAIARRQNVSGGVSHSISQTGNVTAVGVLLENQTAEILSDTMENITELASNNDQLHGPLAGRSDLPEFVLKRMAGFVGTTIVEELIDKYPLTATNQKQLRTAVSARIEASDVSAISEAKNRDQHYRVLLADDDRDMRNFLRQVIESLLDADVTAVDDGDLALQHVNNGEVFDLIISDWMMPNMSGIEFLRAVRGNGNATPFAMLTARRDVDSIVAAQNDGVNAFITKPVSAEEIVKKLKVLLR